METRKLQQVGGGTFTVSIPKEWAIEHALEAGAEVHLYTHGDGSVVVRSAERDGGHLDEARVALDDAGESGDDTDASESGDDTDATPPADAVDTAGDATPPADAVDTAGDATTPADGVDRVTRTLRAAQTAGFDTVRLTHPDAFGNGQRRAARSLAADLVGTDVVVEREDELAVRNLLDAGDVSVRQSVVQLQFVACSVHEAATAALRDAESGAAERLRERREEADRLFGMVARHCNRGLASFATVDRLGVSRPELFDYYETARQLKHVADEGVRVAAVAERLSDPPTDPVAETVERLGVCSRTVVEDAAAAVLEGTDIAAAHAALDDCDAVAADAEALEAALFDATGPETPDRDRAGGSDSGDATEPVTDGSGTNPDGTGTNPDGTGTAADGPGTAVDLSGTTPIDRLALARALDPLARTVDHGGRVARVALRAGIRAGNGHAAGERS